ncbi:hypothetical protein ACIQCR_24560 [Streptomyces sp. NPDC093249]|uniref:hypothetical protein n=1 Tax=unclassified Streptomyces TaxID=2593676 RepID=UPI003820232B
MPSLPPPRTTELYYDGGWHPVSVRESSAVTITRGLTGKGSRAEPASASMTLGNRGGEVSVHDPSAALYGKIGRNTPIRFSVDAGRPRLLFPESGVPLVSTPSHPSLAVTGDLDVRVDIAPSTWSDTAALVSRHRFAGSQVSYVFLIGQNKRLQLLWSPNGTTAAQRYVTSTAPVPAYAGQRLVVRAVLDINDGSGCTARFFYARRLDSVLWLPVGAPVTLAGTTGIHTGTAPLDIGDSDLSVTPDGASGLDRVRGRVYAVQVYDGPTLTVDVRPEQQATPGAGAFTDGAGRVWTLSGGAALSNRHVRLEGEVPAWPPERHISGNDSVVAITPGGIMRRLGIGRKPLDSALRRLVTASGPVECWPLTDGSEATQGAALRGGPPMAPAPGSTRLAWAGGELAPWVEPVLRADTGATSDLSATAPPSTAAAAGWSLDWSRSGQAGTEFVRLTDRGTGTAQLQWVVVTDSATGAVRVLVERIGTEDGPQMLVNLTSVAIFDDAPHHLRLKTVPSGSITVWYLYIDGVLAATDAWSTAGAALRTVRVTALLGAVGSTPLSLGYVTYWGPGEPPAAEVHRALTGMTGESAGARVARVAAEQGVPLRLDGEAASTTPLGVQTRQTFLDTLETATDADMGLLLDQRDARALLVRARHTLYTQAPAVTLTYAGGIISGEFRPVDDDRLARNEVTTKRADGGEHTATETVGRMSVQDPPLGIGRYDEADTYSLAADEQTIGQAWWRLHVGVYGGLRYPRVTVDLANPRAFPLIADLLAADVGDLLRLRLLPREYGTGADLLIRGYTETISAKGWTITFICDPGAPWRVGIYDDPANGKYDTSGCQLTTGITATATSFSVTTTTGLRWTTTPGEMPLVLTVGGEEIRVTAVTGNGLTQTLTAVRSTNGVIKPHPAGTPVSLARPAVYAL